MGRFNKVTVDFFGGSFRADQNPREKKGKTKSDKAPNGPFILPGGPDHEIFPRKEHGYGFWKMAMLLQLLRFESSGMRELCSIF